MVTRCLTGRDGHSRHLEAQAEHGWQPTDPAEFLREPWLWESEHELFCAERRGEAGTR